MPPTLEETIKPTPELLYLLCGDPVELSAVLAGMQPPDIAEALRELEPEAAAKVLAALPFDLAVQIFDEPELVQHRSAIVAVLAQGELEARADQRPIVGGRRGHHSEHLGHLLAAMQFLPRTYPDAKW